MNRLNRAQCNKTFLAAIFEFSEYAIVFFPGIPSQPSIKFLSSKPPQFSTVLSIPNLKLFSLYLQWLPSHWQFSDFYHFSLNKSFKTCLRPILQPGVNFTYQFAQCAKAPAESKFHKKCSSVWPKFLLKFYCMFEATAFALSAIFLWFYANCFCCWKNLKLYMQKLLCLDTKNVGEIDPRNWQLIYQNFIYIGYMLLNNSSNSNRVTLAPWVFEKSMFVVVMPKEPR